MTDDMLIVVDPLQEKIRKINNEISFKCDAYIEWALKELGITTKNLKPDAKSLKNFSDQLDKNNIEVTNYQNNGTVSFNIFKDGDMKYQFGYYISKDYNVHFDIVGLGPKWNNH